MAFDPHADRGPERVVVQLPGSRNAAPSQDSRPSSWVPSAVRRRCASWMYDAGRPSSTQPVVASGSHSVSMPGEIA
ncbi:hypothetical protein P9209_11705 [Prescottella defluvii]|nr:hypothetical protein P9209_11705 [Prescottella defluvii]